MITLEIDDTPRGGMARPNRENAFEGAALVSGSFFSGEYICVLFLWQVHI